MPHLITKLESSVASGSKRKNSASGVSTGSGNSQFDGEGGRSTTPPMQSLARMNNKIRLDRAEVEQQPGGKTVMMPIGNLETDKK